MVDILYVSIKPSPSREKLMPRWNRPILSIIFMASTAIAGLRDVYHLMLNAQGIRWMIFSSGQTAYE